MATTLFEFLGGEDGFDCAQDVTTLPLKQKERIANIELERISPTCTKYHINNNSHLHFLYLTVIQFRRQNYRVMNRMVI